MRDIALEINGKMVSVTESQLRDAIDKRFVSLDARVVIDGQELRARNAVAFLQSGRFGADATPDAADADVSSANGSLFNIIVDESVKLEYQSRKERRGRRKFVAFTCVSILILAAAEFLYLQGKNKEDAGPNASSSASSERGQNASEDKKNQEETRSAPEGEEKERPFEKSRSSESRANSDGSSARGTTSTTPFDESTDFVDADYQGVELSRLYASLDKLWTITRERGESDAEFWRRKTEYYSQAEKKTLFDSITYESRLAFNTRSERADRASRAYVSIAYDRFERSIRATLKPIRVLGGDDPDNPEITLCLSKETRGMEGRYYGVTFDAPVGLETEPSLTAVFTNAVLEDAEELEGELEALVVFSNAYKDDDGPRTSTCLTKGAWNDVYSTYAQDVEVVFYNRRSGKILGKFPIDQMNLPEANEDRWDRPIEFKRTGRGGAQSNAGAETAELPFDAAPKEPAKPVNPVNPAGYASSPIREDATNLGKNYLGHNYQTIRQALASNCPLIKKSEFETKNEFSKRQKLEYEAYSHAKLYDDMSYTSRFARVFPSNGEYWLTVNSQYDAERSRMTVKCGNIFFQEYSQSKPAKYKIAIGQGSGTHIYDISMAFTVADVEYSKNLSANFSITLSDVPRDKAIDYKGSLRLIMVYSLSEHWLARPNDNANLIIKDVEFWVYCDKTGEVLAKYPLKDVLRNRTKKLGDFRTPLNRDGARGLDQGANQETAEKPEKSEIVLPTWDELYSRRADVKRSWEGAEPTIALPEDAASLEEAIAQAGPGDVLSISGVVPLRSPSSSAVVARVDKPLTILGDPGARIEVGVNESLEIASGADVQFKGVVFKSLARRGDLGAQPTISLVGGSATFKSCELDGDRLSSSSGVSAVGSGSRAEFWDCVFTRFESRAAQATEGASIVLKYCQFDDCKSECAYAFDEGSVEAIRTRFANSGSGYVANAGGSGKLEECRFENNRADWEITSTSRKKVEIVDCASDKDAEK